MTDSAAIVVAIPVLNRPERVEPLLASLQGSSGHASTRAMFLASPGDRREQEALRASGADFLVVPWQPGPGDWARKLNLALRESTEPWLFTGADDLDFHAGWADRALECAAAKDAGVIGTNDLGNPNVIRGLHATHSLVRRTYAELGTIDARGKPGFLHEGYDHQFVDNELVETARARDAWTYCAAAVVEHLHPHWNKGTHDRTYAKGQAKFGEDRRLFQKRAPLWGSGRVRSRR